jgi:hypothetical protein
MSAQIDELAQQGNTQEAIAGLCVWFPIHQDLAAPEASRSDFLAPAEVGDQPRVGVLEGSLYRR